MVQKKIPLYLFVWILLFPMLADSARIRDLCEIQGARGNILKGIGLVVGLAGTGDSVGVTRLAQRQMLDRLGITVSNLKDLTPKNSAIVMVTAEIPPFAKEGTRIDVKIDTLGDCKSLEGGMLLETHLRGPGLGETVYAVAQGPISIGGFNAEKGGGGSTAVRKNHPTSGRIPLG
ncbi:MAG: flagellar basal body P-ring protein FlgI, partial [Candidatus Hydrogenedens sp.]